MSPGLVWVRMPGSTRASAQPMIRIFGRLAFGRELLEQVEMLAVIAGAEILESLEKPFQRHDVSPTMPRPRRQGEMTQELLYDKRGDIGWITFNRPQARNALTFAMYEGLAEICGRVGQTREVKALVITGAGDKAFAAGTDIAQFQDVQGRRGRHRLRAQDRPHPGHHRTLHRAHHRCHRRLLHRRRGGDRGGLRPQARHHQRPVRLSHRPHAGQLPVDGQLRPAGRPDRPAAHQGGDLPGQADRRPDGAAASAW